MIVTAGRSAEELVTLLVAENSTQQALDESALREAVAPAGITANAILAGVTDTPALLPIPGHAELVKIARQRNPHERS